MSVEIGEYGQSFIESTIDKIKEAKERKDWLPYFSDSYSKNFKEAKEYRDKNNKRGKYGC